jgi:hypothetical protein
VFLAVTKTESPLETDESGALTDRLICGALSFQMIGLAASY